MRSISYETFSSNREPIVTFRYKNVDISIVIPTKNRPENIRRLLHNLLPLRFEVNFMEMIIVDDSYLDVFTETHDYIKKISKEFSDQVNIIHIRGKNIGANSARNQGINLATGNFILFLDDDVELLPGYLKSIIKPFDETFRVGAAGGIIINLPKSSRIERLFKRIFFLSQVRDSCGGYLLPSGFPVHIGRCDVMKKVAVLSGSNMCVRREVLIKYQFDERMRGYSYLDDVDFCLRVGAEYDLRVVPDARVIHNTNIKSESFWYHRSKILYHFMLVRQPLIKPKINKIAFYISIVGNAIQSFFAVWMCRTLDPLRGFVSGLKEAII